MDSAKKTGRGGKRPNQTGRPPVADKRVTRGAVFNDAEWGLIKNNAAKRKLSISGYIVSLAEKDATCPHDPPP